MKRGYIVDGPNHRERYLDRLARQFERQETLLGTSKQRMSARRSGKAIRWLMSIDGTQHELTKAELGHWKRCWWISTRLKDAAATRETGDREKDLAIRQHHESIDWVLERLKVEGEL